MRQGPDDIKNWKDYLKFLLFYVPTGVILVSFLHWLISIGVITLWDHQDLMEDAAGWAINDLGEPLLKLLKILF